MTDKYYTLGETRSIDDVCSFEWPETQNLYKACLSNRSFTVIEKQIKKDSNDNLLSESIVVDCFCGEIGTRNKVGIKNRERLALCCSKNDSFPYTVFALRKDFPLTVHQITIASHMPRALCIYLEPWSTCKRTWTPQQFLNRIILWLVNASREILHGHDLPPEHIFFQSVYKVFLPNKFSELAADNKNILFLQKISTNSEEHKYFNGHFINKKHEAKFREKNMPVLDSLIVNLPPAVHRDVEALPHTFGELADSLVARQSGFIEYLALSATTFLGHKYEIKGGHFLLDDENRFTILICNIPISRAHNASPERQEIHGFVLSGGVKYLAVKLGIASVVPKKGGYVLNSCLIGEAQVPISNHSWREVDIDPIEIRTLYTEDDARKASGIDYYEKFYGVLGGVGALGSALADVWSREGWGDWMYVDPDYIEPHNIVRHTATSKGVGLPKANYVGALSFDNYQADNRQPVCGRLNDFSNEQIEHALNTSSLIVDATTTLDAPRDLALRNSIGRCVSVFLSPSGNDSVLLFEDADRKIRLNHLEYQYYRLLIREKIGEHHLIGNSGQFWVGGGCREITAVMPYDIIRMHSGLLARQIRIRANQDSAIIKNFMHDDATGAISTYEQQGIEVYTKQTLAWHVVYDDVLIERMKVLRNEALPLETGGVLVGYIDQVTQHIYVVDALPAPTDSVHELTSFERGCIGLQQTLLEISKKTASIVTYIGEWHSHPAFCSSCPSQLDFQLLAVLKKQMNQDGLPVLMFIVSDGDCSVHIGEEKS